MNFLSSKCVSSLFCLKICFNQARKEDSEIVSLGPSSLSLETCGTCGITNLPARDLRAAARNSMRTVNRGHPVKPCLQNQTEAMGQVHSFAATNLLPGK